MTKVITAAMLAVATFSSYAEQAKTFPAFDVHYVVVNTRFLNPEVAARYRITRAEDRAIVNLSVLDKSGVPIEAEIKGTYRNILSQTFDLVFTRHGEGTAIYYIAELKYTDQDLLTFSVEVSAAGAGPESFSFQERMYLERDRNRSR